MRVQNLSKKSCLKSNGFDFAKRLLRLVLFSMIYFSGNSISGVEEEVRESINDPSMSTRCKRLLTYRDQKVLLKQKSASLIKRAMKMEKIIPEHKKTVKKKMDIILNQLHQEQAILDFQINNLEEDIVRKGCPGINL